MVFKHEDADKFGFIEQRQAKNRPHLVLTDIRIRDEPCPGGGIVDNHALAGVLDVINHRLRQQRFSDDLVAKTYNDCLVATYRLRRDPGFTATRQDQQAALRSRLLECGAQKCSNQVILHNRT